MKDSKAIERKRIGDGGVDRYFWIGAVLLGVLLVSVLMRDLHRPIYGMHSWAEAHTSWLARAQLKYGFGYTKGLKTWAVGDPPVENPGRYMDHPQLPTLLTAAGMRIFGWRDMDKALGALEGVQDAKERQDARKALQRGNDAALRKVNLAIALGTLSLLFMLLRPLLGDGATLLAGLFYVLFPLTGYFGMGSWVVPTSLLAFWCYFVLIGGIPGGPAAKRRHMWGLAICLFLMLQFSWSGFFYALGIGVHYVGGCVLGRKWPKGKLLTVLIAAPLLSLGLDFLIMAYGYDWEWNKILDLFMWRATTGEKKTYTYGNLWDDFWRHALTNFTLPVLLAAGVGLAWQLLRAVWSLMARTGSAILGRGFPFLWVFLLPGVFQILTFKGALEQHQTWERPLSAFVAIGAALGIMLVGDLVGKLGRRWGMAAMAIFIGVIWVQCAAGLDYYHGERHYSPTLVRLWQKLNAEIPPNKKLLAYHDFKVMQHPAKGAHYRPEVAWYLDREIVAARPLYRDRNGKIVPVARWPYIKQDWTLMPAETLRQIETLAKTGEYSRLLYPSGFHARNLNPLLILLRDRYSWEYIEPDPKLGRDPRYGAQMIFNLEEKNQGR